LVFEREGKKTIEIVQAFVAMIPLQLLGKVFSALLGYEMRNSTQSYQLKN